MAGEEGTEAQDRARSSLWCFVSATTNTNTHRNFLSASVVVARLTVTCAGHREEDNLLRQSELDSWLVGSLVRLLGEDWREIFVERVDQISPRLSGGR